MNTSTVRAEDEKKLIHYRLFSFTLFPLILHPYFLSHCYYKSLAQGVFILLQQVSHSRELEDPDRHLAAGSAPRTLRALLPGSYCCRLLDFRVPGARPLSCAAADGHHLASAMSELNHKYSNWTE